MSARPLVLVHGAWHGAWCWNTVADLLRAQGHRVVTPTLAGLGDRAHLLNTEINLDTHIADIIDVFEREHLQDALLVAHSYGGWPTSGALEHIHDRVTTLVFLETHLPRNGIDTSNHRDDIIAARVAGKTRIDPPQASEFVSERHSRRSEVDDAATADRHVLPTDSPHWWPRARRE